MPALADLQAHQRLQGKIIADLEAELRTVWADIAQAPPPEVRAELAAVLPLLLAEYGSASGAVAADFYDDLRNAAAVAGTYYATVADTPGPQDATSLAGWVTGRLVDTLAAPADPDVALSRLLVGSQKRVGNVGRLTIGESADADPAAPTYFRYASANACNFCRVMAARGDVYTSEAAARFVVGRRGRPRGTRNLGDKYHDDCRCIAAAVWPGEDYTPPPYYAQWDREYQQAAKATTAPGEPVDLSAVLAHMRQANGAR